MFNKLLSNLPFNPSLINQVAFYSKRLKQETSVRRLGFILVALTILLQLFAVLSPAQPSLAIAGNDLLPGGVRYKSQMVQHCLNNDYDFKTILAHYAISCSNLQNNSVEVSPSLSSIATKNGLQLYSMGHIPQGPVNSVTHKITNEVNVSFNHIPLFMRLLSSWDSGPSSNYRALSVGNAFGVQYFILFSCGNLVQWGKPVLPAPKPTPPTKPTPPPTPKLPVISKKATNITEKIADANNTTAKAGDIIMYTLFAKNIGKVTYTKFIMKENISDILEYADIYNLFNATHDGKGNLTWTPLNIGAGQTAARKFSVKVKNPIPKTPEPCNPAVVHPCPGTGSFDLTMTNVYGNTINIKLKPPAEKIVEVTTTKTLTNTGPGTSLIIGFSVAAVVGYFFARSRMMAKELDLVRSDYTSGGI